MKTPIYAQSRVIPEASQRLSGTQGPSALRLSLGPGSTPGFRRGSAGMTRKMTVDGAYPSLFGAIA